MDNISQRANSGNGNYPFGELFLVQETLGDRIKAFAKARYGTQKALAEALGMPESQLSGYVKGVKAPASDVMERFRQAGMSIDWLLSGEGEMDAAPPPNPIGIDLRTIDRKAFKSLEALIKSVSEELDKLKPDGEDDEAEELAEP
jgi:transcriptional regulator with XRE-family HTH domain